MKTNMQFSCPDGVQLTGDVVGPTDGPVVVLLHGGGQTRHSWAKTLEDLAMDGFRAVAVDLRGHGDSGWSPEGNYAVEAIARDVRTVADHFGRPVALVGASLGGSAAILASGEPPPVECSGLILVDVTPYVSEDGRQEVLDFMNTGIDGFGSVEEAAEAISRYTQRPPKIRDIEGLGKNLRKCADGRYRWHWDPALVDPKRLDETKGDPARLEAATKTVTAPILLVRGGSSSVVRETHAQAFLSSVPTAEYAEVSHATHMVAGERNAAFSHTVRDFLSRQVRNESKGLD